MADPAPKVQDDFMDKEEEVIEDVCFLHRLDVELCTDGVARRSYLP